MAIPYSEWLPRAQRLREGRSARVAHECGEGAPMLIEHTADGYRCWCHRCHEGGFKPHGRQALSRIIERWNAAAGDHNDYKIVLPTDYSSRDFPWPAVRWLCKAGVTQALIQKYSIGYSPHFGRVYLPVYSPANRGDIWRLSYYQGRAVHDGQSPKYLNPKADKAALVFSTEYPGPGGGKGPAAAVQNRKEQTAVVTEDILSAIRVGEVRQCVGVSILGTTPSPGQLNYLNQFKQCLIWMDPDAAGKKATRVLQRSLGMIGLPSRAIKSDRDPKLYCHRELQDRLWQLT